MIVARFVSFQKSQETGVFHTPSQGTALTQEMGVFHTPAQGTALTGEPLNQGPGVVEKAAGEGEPKEVKKPKGVALSKHLQDNPLPSAEWCFSLMEQLCDKVKEAHKDKKHYSVLTLEKVRLEQNPKLTDIVGLEATGDKKDAAERQAQQEARLRYWQTNPVYAAPETREQGTESRVDGRADVYSLGVVLYEILTGTVPTSYPPVSLEEANPKYKGFDGLNEIVQTALSPDPEDRYPSVQDFWTAIQEAKEAAKAPKSLSWANMRKTIKKKLKKYLRKKMLKLLQKEIRLWIKKGFSGNKKAAQQGGKQVGKQAMEQAAQQAAQAAAKQVGSMMYQAAAQSAAASTATAVSGVVVVATKGALLAVGVTAGAVTGSYGVEAVSQLPAIQRMIQKPQPPLAVVRQRDNPANPVNPAATTVRPVIPVVSSPRPNVVRAVVPVAEPESCPLSWVQVNVVASQREQIRATLARGTFQKRRTGFCFPADGRHVMLEYPGRVLCILNLNAKTRKTLSIRLRKDPDTILSPDYCVVR